MEKVIQYLGTLNQFFEQGLLGEKVRVFDTCGKTIQRMECGFKFFCEWIEELISQGVCKFVRYTIAFMCSAFFLIQVCLQPKLMISSFCLGRYMYK